MSGTSRPPDEDRSYDRPSTTGRHHVLPDHWHGVPTSPGEWGRIHAGDLLVAAGLVLLSVGLRG